uniref:Aminotran_5 domain-containing protein n=1 Tax=Macrostomum lignano TaxID=282301 RepID=A0A1I8F4W7_9PLAT
LSGHALITDTLHASRFYNRLARRGSDMPALCSTMLSTLNSAKRQQSQQQHQRRRQSRRRRRRLQSAAAAPLKTSGRSPPVSAAACRWTRGCSTSGPHRRPRSRHGALLRGRLGPPGHGGLPAGRRVPLPDPPRKLRRMIKEATALEELPAENHSGGGLGRSICSDFPAAARKSVTAMAREKRAERTRVRGPTWSRFRGCFSKEMLPAEQGYEGHGQFHHGGAWTCCWSTCTVINDRSNKVLDFHHPHQLREASATAWRSPSRRALTSFAMVAMWLTAATNTKHLVWEWRVWEMGRWGMAGSPTRSRLFSCSCEEVTPAPERWREHIQAGESGDGILAPGGSISNLYAGYGGRYNRFHGGVKMRGMRAVPGVVRDVHLAKDARTYSVKKSPRSWAWAWTASTCGGHGQQGGKMLPEHLRAADRTRPQPRSGSPSSFRAPPAGHNLCWARFDPAGRDRRTTCCERHGLWFHVDTAWGGGVLLSQRHRHLLAGVQCVADSVTWNPHKLMGVTLHLCSVILLPERHIRPAARLQRHAGDDYLFQQDKQYDFTCAQQRKKRPGYEDGDGGK